MIRLLAACVAALLAAPATAIADGRDDQHGDRRGDAVRSGDLELEPPTLRSLGLEWTVEGDENRNARVEVRYREYRSNRWRTALPLLRLQNEQVPAENVSDADNANRPPEESAFAYTTPNMFSGSVFDLDPDTRYEVRLRLSDPDGVRGPDERSAVVKTRPVPQPSTGGRTFHVYPVGWTGPKLQPSFEGLLRAYNFGAEHADWNHAYNARVRPGDTILVHAGVYKADRLEYGNYNLTGPGVGGPGYGVPFDGTYLLTGKGTPERPITIKAAGDGEVWFDGNGSHQLFNVQVADYHIFDGINIRNTNIAFDAGIKRIAGAKGLVVRNSRVEDVGTAIQTDYEGSRDFYIADNTFIGRVNPNVLVGWQNSALWRTVPGWPANLASFQGIRLYGPGHVVEHNRVERFHDGIALATYGRPDTLPDTDPPPQLSRELDFDPRYVPGPNSVDVMHNEITNISDVCVEPDGGARNIRVLYNRCFNVAGQAMRSQPAFGGPHYFIRNVVYQAPGANTLGSMTDGAGMVFLNNTTFNGVGGSGSNLHYRNNLVIGTNSPPLMAMTTFTNYSSSDYNGYSPATGQAVQFRWTSPPFEVARSYDRTQFVTRNFATLAAYQAATAQELHSRLLTPAVFQNGPPPDVTQPSRLYSPAELDLRPRPGSPAVDAGIGLPGVTDGATGAAPDLGAYELGAAVPDYGPRG